MGDLWTGNRVVRAKYLSTSLNEVIVALSIMQMILAGAIKALDAYQVFVEVTLMSLLALGCLVIKLSKWQVFLFLILLLVTTFSFFTNSSIGFMILAKNNILAILTLVYFSKVSFNSKLVLPTFVITILLLVFAFISPEIQSFVASMSEKKAFNMSRFGGIFLNAHFNAYFIAIALIYYSQLRYAYGLVGVFGIYYTGSKTMWLSYLGQFVAMCSWGKFVTKNRKIIIFLVSVVFLVLSFVFVTNVDSILKYIINENDMQGNKYNSFVIIVSQIGEPAYYQQLLTLFPTQYVFDVDSGFAEKIGDLVHSGANEIGYFSLVNHCGVFLAIGYLLMLLKYAGFYSIFIFLSLVHYDFILAPISIYMMVQYSRNIQCRWQHQKKLYLRKSSRL